MRRRARLALLCCTVGCLAVAACSKKKKRKTIDEPADTARDAPPMAVVAATWIVPEVKVELVAQQGGERDIDATALARRIGTALRASPYFAATLEDVPTGREAVPAMFVARISYGVIPEGSSGTPASIVTVESTLLPEGVSHLALSDNVITELPLTGKVKEAEMTAAIEGQASRAVDESVAGIIAKEALRDADTATLKKALAAEIDIVLWALELIAHRRHRASLDDVAALLSAKDDRIAGAAITTVVALGDSAAVEPMTRNADFQNHEQLRMIIEASSALGGPDAIEFLEFVVTGHDDDDIKEHATAALERLTRREKDAP